MHRRSAALLGVLLLMATGTTTAFAGGMITAKETGSFVVGDEVGYPDGHSFQLSAGPGTTIDSGIARIPAGASFGWHYHTTDVLVTVTAGSLTLYDPTCGRQVVSAGHGFVEEPNTIHLARNESNGVTTIAWTYVGVQPGQPEDVYEPVTYDPCGGIH
ncbi:MAG TPA: cupin domain-containing protein [Candidatus Limnocylindrales bacterium]